MTNKGIKDLKSRMNKVLNDLQQIVDIIGDEELQNEQFTLNFLDKVNAISVTY